MTGLITAGLVVLWSILSAIALVGFGVIGVKVYGAIRYGHDIEEVMFPTILSLALTLLVWALVSGVLWGM